MEVAGNCPMGCREGLILGEGGVLWCAALLCPRPTAAAEILADAESEHLVAFSETGFIIRHPLRERLDDELMSCALHEFCASMSGPPGPPGRYRAVQAAPGWTWQLQPLT